MSEQARAVKDMLGAAKEVAKQIGLITRSNREHLTASTAILDSLTDIRQITERNTRGVEDTLRGTEALAGQAQRLNGIMDSVGNGFGGKKARKKKKSKK
jgi:methyl-accepting chemotaxis protein